VQSYVPIAVRVLTARPLGVFPVVFVLDYHVWAVCRTGGLCCIWDQDVPIGVGYPHPRGKQPAHRQCCCGDDRFHGTRSFPGSSGTTTWRPPGRWPRTDTTIRGSVARISGICGCLRANTARTPRLPQFGHASLFRNTPSCLFRIRLDESGNTMSSDTISRSNRTASGRPWPKTAPARGGRQVWCVDRKPAGLGRPRISLWPSSSPAAGGPALGDLVLKYTVAKVLSIGFVVRMCIRCSAGYR